MSKVKRRRVPRYGHVTEGGHDWFVQSWSDFGSHPGAWHIWCDDCSDYHFVREVDPLSMPEAAQKAFAKKLESTA